MKARLISPATCLVLAASFLVLFSTQATVTNVAWYRLGENDPGGISSFAVTNTTQDSVGTNHLKQVGSPRYTNAVSSFASNTTLAVTFNGTSQLLTNRVLLSAVTDNFGMEAWVKPSSTNVNVTIVYNGNQLLGNGWALWQKNGTFEGVWGSDLLFGGTAQAGTWTHVAMVRNQGTNALYVNGTRVAALGPVGSPDAPTGAFTIGGAADVDFPLFYPGTVDEVRVFTFGNGQFTENDLLINLQQVNTLPATGVAATSVTLNGNVNPNGNPASGWFEWGTTTNYGNATITQSLGSGVGYTNFSQSLNGLSYNVTYQFRAAISNAIRFLFSTNQSFTTLTPTVETLPATALHPGQATFNALINRDLNFDSCWFEHGLTTNYGSTTVLQTLAGTGVAAVSNLVTGLPRGVPYHFRAVAKTGLTETPGNDVVFATRTNNFMPSGVAGGGQPIDLRQPALELNFIFCTEGIFPNRYLPRPPAAFLSEIRMFAGSVVPAGWALCQGQLLDVTNNEALFALIGTTYGGDGQTNFALPDFRGRAPGGDGQGISHLDLGEMLGLNLQTLASNQLPTHAHTLPAPDDMTDPAGGSSPFLNQKPTLGIAFVISEYGNYPGDAQTVLEPFIGQVTPYAGVLGLLEPAQGALLNTFNNQTLFSVLGTNFGGDGQTTFALPDLRGRTPMGTGTGDGPATFALSQSSGGANTLLTTNQIPSHRHAVPSGYTGFVGSNQPISLLHPVLALRCLISTNGQPPSPTTGVSNTIMGEMTFYAGTNVPAGWALCDGQLLAISSAPALFGAISNRFGGDGITTFALPDMSARIPVGATNSLPGASYGAQQTVLDEAQLPLHTHSVPAPDYDRWITSFGLKDATAAFGLDFDADGLMNGYEWATGSNPTNTLSTATLTISDAGPAVAVRFPRNTNATDVVFTLQRAANIGASTVWSGIATNQSGVWSPPTIVTQSGTTNPVQVIITDWLTNTPAAFYRLKLDWP